MKATPSSIFLQSEIRIPHSAIASPVEPAALDAYARARRLRALEREPRDALLQGVHFERVLARLLRGVDGQLQRAGLAGREGGRGRRAPVVVNPLAPSGAEPVVAYPDLQR